MNREHVTGLARTRARPRVSRRKGDRRNHVMMPTPRSQLNPTLPKPNGRPCRICSHADRPAIENMARSRSFGAASRTYGIPLSSVSRHMNRHASGASTTPPAETPDGATDGNQARRYRLTAIAYMPPEPGLAPRRMFPGQEVIYPGRREWFMEPVTDEGSAEPERIRKFTRAR